MLTVMAALVGRVHLKHQAIASMVLSPVEIDQMDDVWTKRVGRAVAKGARAISKVPALNKMVFTDGCNVRAVHRQAFSSMALSTKGFLEGCRCGDECK